MQYDVKSLWIKFSSFLSLLMWVGDTSFISPSSPESLTDTNNSQMRLLYLNSSYGLSLHSEKSYYLLFHKPELKSLNKGSSSILLLFLIYLKSFKNM